MTVTQELDYWTHVTTSMVDKVIQTGKPYQILEELGRGSYGCLFLGQCLSDNSYVAIKVLSKSGLDPQQLALQHLEIEIQSSLRHPNLLALHGVAQDSDYIYMVMELCDQGDLFDFVIRNKIRDDLVTAAFVQILEAVEHMHAQNVYHRDLKLENILLKTGANDALECKVADFGLATREQYNMEFGCGSTTYLAPEHFDDRDNDSDLPEHMLVYDAAASDVWSLGILLLALLFGRNPWEEATSMDAAYRAYKKDPAMLKYQLFPTLSDRCYRLLKAVLSPNPADRPTVTAMRHQFLALDRLVIDPEEEDDECSASDSYSCDSSSSVTLSSDQEFGWPVDIPTTLKTPDKASYDSAVFSGTYRGRGESWSDMVEQDDLASRHHSFHQQNYHHHHSFQHHHALASLSALEEEEDLDMFVHHHEKESWWL